MMLTLRDTIAAQDARHHLSVGLLLLVLELFVLLVVHMLVVHLLLIVAMFGRELLEGIRQDRTPRPAV